MIVAMLLKIDFGSLGKASHCMAWRTLSSFGGKAF